MFNEDRMMFNYNTHLMGIIVFSCRVIAYETSRSIAEVLGRSFLLDLSLSFSLLSMIMRTVHHLLSPSHFVNRSNLTNSCVVCFDSSSSSPRLAIQSFSISRIRTIPMAYLHRNLYNEAEVV